MEGGIVISLARMNKVLELDIKNETATVEADVINLWLSDALAKLSSRSLNNDVLGGRQAWL
ncbi:FAD-binding protein [Vulcanisaeta souniana]|nr:FAD-binding protein [Vulcanisaeta souniana]